MRISDKKILDAFFKQRTKVMCDGIENIEAIEASIAKKIGSTSPDDSTIFTLCVGLQHYREVAFFHEHPLNKDIIGGAVVFLKECTSSQQFILDIAEVTVATIAFPFVRGDTQEVYDYLYKTDIFYTYFEGIKILSKAYENIKDRTNQFFDIHINSMLEQAYSVWRIYAEENHLSDYIFMLFLETDLQFEHIVTLNDINSKDIIGMTDEWRAK